MTCNYKWQDCEISPVKTCKICKTRICSACLFQSRLGMAIFKKGKICQSCKMSAFEHKYLRTSSGTKYKKIEVYDLNKTHHDPQCVQILNSWGKPCFDDILISYRGDYYQYDD